MAEMTYASNGKGNLGVTLGAIGTGLGVLGNGLGGFFNGFNNGYGAQGQKVPQWVSKDEFDTDSKMIDVYERLDSKIRTLEGTVNNFKAEQGVINAQVISNISVMQNQIAVLNSLTKTVIPITNVCPQPMKEFNSWTAPTTGASA